MKILDHTRNIVSMPHPVASSIGTFFKVQKALGIKRALEATVIEDEEQNYPANELPEDMLNAETPQDDPVDDANLIPEIDPDDIEGRKEAEDSIEVDLQNAAAQELLLALEMQDADDIDVEDIPVDMDLEDAIESALELLFDNTTPAIEGELSKKLAELDIAPRKVELTDPLDPQDLVKNMTLEDKAEAVPSKAEQTIRQSDLEEGEPDNPEPDPPERSEAPEKIIVLPADSNGETKVISDEPIEDEQAEDPPKIEDAIEEAKGFILAKNRRKFSLD